MDEVLYKLPFPSSSRTTGPNLTALPRRQCEISYYVESEGGDQKVSLLFEGVEAYRCTYMSACSPEAITRTYDQLVRFDGSTWLAKVASSYDLYHRGKQDARRLSHLAIYFDDGPCYEIICTGFRSLK